MKFHAPASQYLIEHPLPFLPMSLSERPFVRFLLRHRLLSCLVVLVLGVAGWSVFRTDPASTDVLPEDVPVTDTLALNLILTPTLDCLPLYHAVESGIADSMGLSLSIRTETSQFDIDSIMRRTRRYDGAVFDDQRLARYQQIEGKASHGSAKEKSARKSQRDAATKRPAAKQAAAASRRPMPALTEAIRLQSQWRFLTSATVRIREVQKLRKRTVAIARFAASSACLRDALASAGLKEADVYQAQINDFGIRTDMLTEAQVDAAILPEPFATTARLRGHRVVWSAPDSISRSALCFRSVVLENPQKQQQMELLKKVYERSAADLNRRGTHAADSALIKAYHLPSEVIDTLRLPIYRVAKR